MEKPPGGGPKSAIGADGRGCYSKTMLNGLRACSVLVPAYLLAGYVLHAMFVGLAVDFSTATSWFWLLAWPSPFIVIVLLTFVVIFPLRNYRPRQAR